MSDVMQSAMLRADDAYAGSESFYRMEKKLVELFGLPYILPAHQGRACENILATRFVKPDDCVIMNYHFTTAKAHITRLGGLRFVHEPKTLRFFTGKLEATSDWPEKLAAAYKADFGEDQ